MTFNMDIKQCVRILAQHVNLNTQEIQEIPLCDEFNINSSNKASFKRFISRNLILGASVIGTSLIDTDKDRAMYLSVNPCSIVNAISILKVNAEESSPPRKKQKSPEEGYHIILLFYYINKILNNKILYSIFN